MASTLPDSEIISQSIFSRKQLFIFLVTKYLWFCDWSTVLVANLDWKMIQFYVLSRENVFFRKNKIVVQLWTRLTGECLLYSLFWPPFFKFESGGSKGALWHAPDPLWGRQATGVEGGGGDPLAAKLKKNLEDALLCKSSLSFRISI